MHWILEENLIGAELKLRDGGNVYTVEEVDGRHLLLKCIWFSCKENLGDLIFCNREGQKIWISKYHAQHYERIL